MDMARSIEIKCKAARAIPLDKFEDFQGKLKSLSPEAEEKLRNQILESGFSFPIAVWEDQGKYHIIDGHQRVRALNRLREEGYAIPKLPVALIEADSLEQAKKKLLAAASQYGSVNAEGLYEFLQTSALSLEDVIGNINFPEVDLEKFADEFYADGIPDFEVGDVPTPDSIGDESIMVPEPSHVRMVQLFFTDKTQPQFLEWVDALQEKLGLDNMTDTVFQVVRQQYEDSCS